jgi:hypothetical protein
MNIKEMSTPFYALGLAALMLAYAAQYKKTETKVQEMPIHRETAEGDLCELQNEKTNLAQQIGAGVSMVVPVSWSLAWSRARKSGA